MTNEEAIKFGYNIIMVADKETDSEAIEFTRIAIKALETIPKYKDAYGKGWDDGAKATYEHLKMCEEEQGSDLISRQAVDDAIYDYSRSCDVNYAQIMEYIDKLPSVKQEQKTGHWINITKQNLNDYRTGNKLCFECSECRSQYTYKSNYCPNCGARMESEE